MDSPKTQIRQMYHRAKDLAAREQYDQALAEVDSLCELCEPWPELLVLRGNLIEMSSENSPHSLEEALESYRQAAEMDPEFVDAQLEMGHFHLNVLDDPAAAREHFTQAERLLRQRLDRVQRELSQC